MNALERLLSEGRAKLARQRQEEKARKEKADAAALDAARRHWQALVGAVLAVVPEELLKHSNAQDMPPGFRGEGDFHSPETEFVLRLTPPGCGVVESTWSFTNWERGQDRQWGLWRTKYDHRHPFAVVTYCATYGDEGDKYVAKESPSQWLHADDLATALALAEEQGKARETLQKEADEHNARLEARREARRQAAQSPRTPGERLLDALDEYIRATAPAAEPCED